MFATDAEKARFNMVEQQIRPVDISDKRVLEAFTRVPREHFVDPSYRSLAFADTHLPLGKGEVMMTPIQEGMLLQALDVQPGDRVLEIGTGSGFVTACLAHLGGKVDSYEIDPELSEKAAGRLHSAGIHGVHLRIADIFSIGLPEGGFDAIAVTGSMPLQNDRFTRALAPGGRLFAILGQDPIMQATLFTRSIQGNLKREVLSETLLPPLRNAPQPERFVF